LLGQYKHDAAITLPLEPSAHQGAEGASPWEPLSLAYVVNAERQLVDGAPHHLLARYASAKTDRRWRWHFVEHHGAHEASAYLAAPYDECAVMTLDGRGERATTSYGHFDGERYRRIGQVEVLHSLGLLYEQVTDYLGFLHSSDEYKVMALASYGQPRYLDEFRSLIHLPGDGQYTIDALNLEERFGRARLKGGPLEQRHYDVACSLRMVLEETVFQL